MQEQLPRPQVDSGSVDWGERGVPAGVAAEASLDGRSPRFPRGRKLAGEARIPAHERLSTADRRGAAAADDRRRRALLEADLWELMNCTAALLIVSVSWRRHPFNVCNGWKADAIPVPCGRGLEYDEAVLLTAARAPRNDSTLCAVGSERGNPQSRCRSKHRPDRHRACRMQVFLLPSPRRQSFHPSADEERRSAAVRRTMVRDRAVRTEFSKGLRGCDRRLSLRPDGAINVVNRCRKTDGKTDEARGKAKVVDGVTNAKFKVSFFGPFYGDYRVLDHADDYSWSIVGEFPGRYLWIFWRAHAFRSEGRRPNPAGTQDGL